MSDDFVRLLNAYAEGDLDRRQFMDALAAFGGSTIALSAMPKPAPANPARTATHHAGTPRVLSVGAGETYISHGPLLGRPGATHMGVWARTSRPGTFRVFYGKNQSRLDRVSPPVSTALERDNANWILLEDLEPDTLYHYAVGFEDSVYSSEHQGHFRTLPFAGDYRNSDHNPNGLFNFSFTAGACQRFFPNNTSGLQSYATMLREQGDRVHFGVHTGDWIYEEGRGTSVEAWSKSVQATAEIPDVVRYAPSLVGVWENYKQYLQKNNSLAAWHRNVPTYYMFDDHELVSNSYGSSTPGHFARGAVFRDIGVKAWYDYLAWSNPTEGKILFGRGDLQAGSDILHDPNANFTNLNIHKQGILHIHWSCPEDGIPGSEFFAAGPCDPNSRVYRIVDVIDRHTLRISPPARVRSQSSYSIGRENYFSFSVSNVDFFFLDTRGERGQAEPAFSKKTAASMLGKRQKDWLKRAMTDSRAAIMFVISSVPMAIPHSSLAKDQVDPGRTEEAWPGYMKEREELLDFWNTLDRPIIVVSGDLHNALAVKISQNVWDFTASPLASDNAHTLDIEGDRPPNGRYDSGGRAVDIRWSTFFLPGTKRINRKQPVYAVFQVNNVFNNPESGTKDYWVAYPHPQVVVQFYDANTGELLYAESIVAGL